MCLNRCWTALGLWLVMAAVATAAPMKALIVDGQNAHNWKETTPILKKLLEETGLFTVDVATSPAKGQDMSGFRPDFAAYKLVVLNYQGDDWPEATQKAFVDYVANGGGVVCLPFRGRRVSQVERVQPDHRRGRLGRPQRNGRDRISAGANGQDRPRHASRRARPASTGRSRPSR